MTDSILCIFVLFVCLFGLIEGVVLVVCTGRSQRNDKAEERCSRKWKLSTFNMAETTKGKNGNNNVDKNPSTVDDGDKPSS